MAAWVVEHVLQPESHRLSLPVGFGLGPRGVAVLRGELPVRRLTLSIWDDRQHVSVG